MAFPTLSCTITGLYSPVFGTPVKPAVVQHNMVIVESDTGVWESTATCNGLTSAFLPSPSYNGLDAADWAVLWPQLIGLLVFGFLWKQLLKVLAPRGF